MSENVCSCPKCHGVAIKDREERESVKVMAITIHGYCQKCGGFHETIFIPNTSYRGKQLAKRLAQGI